MENEKYGMRMFEEEKNSHVFFLIIDKFSVKQLDLSFTPS